MDYAHRIQIACDAAWQSGVDDFHAGAERDENPYGRIIGGVGNGDPRQVAWDEGWADARDEREA